MDSAERSDLLGVAVAREDRDACVDVRTSTDPASPPCSGSPTTWTGSVLNSARLRTDRPLHRAGRAQERVEDPELAARRGPTAERLRPAGARLVGQGCGLRPTPAQIDDCAGSENFSFAEWFGL